MAEALKGLRASIYSNPRYNCSNGGISERAHDVTIVGSRDDSFGVEGGFTPLPVGSRVFTPADDAPACILVRRLIGGQKVVHIEPLEKPAEGRTPYMAGGAFVSTSDSRFKELTGFYGAVSLHDRTETWAQYEALSR